VSTFLVTDSRNHRLLHSLPTRRSSDLRSWPQLRPEAHALSTAGQPEPQTDPGADRRGTRQPEGGEAGAVVAVAGGVRFPPYDRRSEEHTSELQSRGHLVCRLLLEKKKF